MAVIRLGSFAYNTSVNQLEFDTTKGHAIFYSFPPMAELQFSP